MALSLMAKNRKHTVRKAAELRLEEVVDAAIELFSARGYRLTKLDDVAAQIGVSAPAMYNYVQGKDALFDLAVRRAVFYAQPLSVAKLPVPTPPSTSTFAFIRQLVAAQPASNALSRAMTPHSKIKVDAEFSGILSELFDTLAFFRRGIRLIERCALDRPDLYEAWFGGARADFQMQLSEYFQQRVKSGRFRRSIFPQAAAKLCIEAVAYSAMHRHYDPRGVTLDDATAKATVIDAMVAAFVAKT